MNRMTEWKQLTEFLVLLPFSLGLGSNIPGLSSVHRETQEDGPFFSEAETSLKILWEWEAESDHFFCRMETFYHEEFYFIYTFIYLPTHELVVSQKFIYKLLV